MSEVSLDDSQDAATRPFSDHEESTDSRPCEGKQDSSPASNAPQASSATSKTGRAINDGEENEAVEKVVAKTDRATDHGEENELKKKDSPCTLVPAGMGLASLREKEENLRTSGHVKPMDESDDIATKRKGQQFPAVGNANNIGRSSLHSREATLRAKQLVSSTSPTTPDARYCRSGLLPALHLFQDRFFRKVQEATARTDSGGAGIEVSLVSSRYRAASQDRATGAFHAVPTFQPHVELAQSGGSPLAEQATQHQDSESTEGSWTRHWKVILGLVALICIVIVISIVVVSFGSSSGSNQSGTECHNAVGALVTPRYQCICGEEIITMAPQTKVNYERLKRQLVPRIYEAFDEPMESCSLRNQALAHVAADPGVVYDEARVVTRYLLTYTYLAWGGDDWERNSGWLSPAPACDWIGVTCVDGVVAGLELGQNNLRGQPVPETFFLDTLEWLILNDNAKLKGTIPTEIGLLSNLVDFSLHGSSITGGLPTEIGSMSSLQTLDFGSIVDLSGTLPREIGQIESLRVLRVQSKSLTGTIPSEIGSLTNMSEFDVSHSSLTGTLPTEMHALSRLTTVALSETRLTGPMTGSVLSNFPLLTIMNLGDNYFVSDDSLLPTILNYTDAIEIYINEMGIRGRLDGSALAKMSNLKIFQAVKNSLQGTIPTEIGLMTNLVQLAVGINMLSGRLPTEIGSCSNLEAFMLGENDITGVIPDELAILSNLEEISAGTTFLKGTLSSSFCRVKKISRPCNSDLQNNCGTLCSECKTCGQVTCPICAAEDANEGCECDS